MGDVLADSWEKVSAWFRQAHELQWIEEAELRELAHIERQTPADLFDGTTARPLVVAFFGGTGVGKSSLLNRLAGDEIARTGVERPTSHEVTAFVHSDVMLARLPEGMPLERVRVSRHHDDRRRDVMWVDMPDIDSTEVRNRQLALAWLPHIDLLVYVVSPERYRDEAGWRVLRERGHKHGWLFIMNRWDEGTDEQIVDLSTNLHKAGFKQPLILRTCCASSGCPDADDFPRLEETIRTLQAEHGQRELERRGQGVKLRELVTALKSAGERLGTDASWQSLRGHFIDNWSQAQAAIVDGMTWPIREFAASFQTEKAPALKRLLGARGLRDVGTAVAKDADGGTTKQHSSTSLAEQVQTRLWDRWANAKLEGVLDELELGMRRAGIATTPLLGSLRGVTATAHSRVSESVTHRLRLALSRPGTLLQRALRRITGAGVVLLPVAALGWVGVHVVRGYYRGVTEQAEFLGINFAINSVLLVLVAWLAPFLLHRFLKPSVEQTARRALQDGLAGAMEEMRDESAAIFARVDAARQELLADAKDLVGELEARLPPARPSGAALGRLVPEPQNPPI